MLGAESRFFVEWLNLSTRCLTSPTHGLWHPHTHTFLLVECAIMSASVEGSPTWEVLPDEILELAYKLARVPGSQGLKGSPLQCYINHSAWQCYTNRRRSPIHSLKVFEKEEFKVDKRLRSWCSNPNKTSPPISEVGSWAPFYGASCMTLDLVAGPSSEDQSDRVYRLSMICR